MIEKDGKIKYDEIYKEKMNDNKMTEKLSEDRLQDLSKLLIINVKEYVPIFNKILNRLLLIDEYNKRYLHNNEGVSNKISDCISMLIKHGSINNCEEGENLYSSLNLIIDEVIKEMKDLKLDERRKNIQNLRNWFL